MPWIPSLTNAASEDISLRCPRSERSSSVPSGTREKAGSHIVYPFSIVSVDFPVITTSAGSFYKIRMRLRNCIERYLQTSTRCPVCKERYTVRDVVDAPEIDTIIESYTQMLAPFKTSLIVFGMCFGLMSSATRSCLQQRICAN